MNVLQYTWVTFSIFVLGLVGIAWNRTNLLIILMSIEVMLLGVDLSFVVFSVYLDDIFGQVFTLFILTLASAESAIGLAIVVIYYRLRHNLRLEIGESLRG